MHSVDEILSAIRKQIHDEHTVICPHCGHEINTDDSDFYTGRVTYWGEDEPAECWCLGCDAVFYVKEHVKRTWTSGRTPDEASSA